MLRLGLLLLALVSGGLAALLAINIRPQPVATPVPVSVPVPTQDVLVASSDLLSGQPLNSENMRWQAWPESTLNNVYITRSTRPDAVETLSGSFVRNRMTMGEPIRGENLVLRRGSYLATILPSGKRAVAVRVSAESTAGGFILPNDRVDILHTEAQGHVSSTILTNIPVLAIDQLVDENGKEDKSKTTVIGRTATLELNPQQAEILTAAQITGTLSLSLRSAADINDRRRPVSQAIRVIRAGRIETVKTQ